MEMEMGASWWTIWIWYDAVTVSAMDSSSRLGWVSQQWSMDWEVRIQSNVVAGTGIVGSCKLGSTKKPKVETNLIRVCDS
ncbi:hypothetical protein TB1_005042 [Malus domestica]